MDSLKYNKVKDLYKSWPNRTVMTTEKLKALGFSHSNIQKYLHSGWIESVGDGAYRKPADKITWEGAVFALIGTTNCHIGGKTALEEHGVAHYIKMHESEVHLFSNGYKPLPKWFLNSKFPAEIKSIKTNFLNTNIGITDKNYGDFKLLISSRERAILEFIYLLNKEHTFQECNLIMQSLATLRPSILQQLLEICRSVRVKRTFLFLATHNKHDYLEELNLSKIDLGSGYREVVKNGIFDPQFQINYPKDLDGEYENKF